MQFSKKIITFALSVAMAGTVHAGDVFKWTDDDGNVHFSDKPAGHPDAVRLEIQSRPTDRARVQAEIQARLDERDRMTEAEANAPQGPTAEEQLAEARQREERCNKYKDRQVAFTQNRRIYRMDENGERVYYDDEEMQAARAEVDELVREYCE